jgi:hypothetical protein
VIDLTNQLLLDREKLASLKSTLQGMYNGYAALEKGYTRVRDIAKANFSLHRLFLDGLWILSPSVRSDSRIRDILTRESRLISDYKTAAARFSKTPVFTAQEMSYITSTWSGLLQKSLQAIEELTMIITDGQLQMSDAQRLQAIDRIDADIRGQYNFLQKFNNALSIQAAQRQKEGNDINTLKQLYGIPH